MEMIQIESGWRVSGNPKKVITNLFSLFKFITRKIPKTSIKIANLPQFHCKSEKKINPVIPSVLRSFLFSLKFLY